MDISSSFDDWVTRKGLIRPDLEDTTFVDLAQAIATMNGLGTGQERIQTRTILDTIGNTPLVELTNMELKPGVRVFAKLEGQTPTGSLKDRIAKYMIEWAEAEGHLTPNRVILEPTSGNTGFGLATTGAHLSQK